jgi:hypothetical protein
LKPGRLVVSGSLASSPYAGKARMHMQAAAAEEIAGECFDAEKLLGNTLEQAGLP